MKIDQNKKFEEIEASNILKPAVVILLNAGIPSAALDARCLLAHVLGREDPVLPHEVVTFWDVDLSDQFNGLLQRRLMGEPVSRIRG